MYILKSRKTDKYYIGSTSDIIDRLLRHNSSRSLYTKSGIPWELIYTEEYSSRSEAMIRERQIKNWKSRKMIEELVKAAK